jgi:2-polyprenyl-3-methyl-5-hydroxy-6-metoxy-1,4-benzoquinol methylase
VSYEKLYRSGGFGYEEDREKWVDWVERHYIDHFELRGRTKRRRRDPKPTLLDIPCGNGFWTSLFRDHGFDVRGIDLSPAGIDAANDEYPDIEFTVGNAEEGLPVGDEKFDVVFSRGISHLHRENLDQPGTHAMAANLLTYVKPEGQLLVSYYTKRDGGGTRSHHYHRAWELVQLFEQAGDIWRMDIVNDFVQISLRPRA